MTCFVDTSFWYAVADTRDASNSRAKSLLRKEAHIITSDYIILETWRLLHHRLGWKTAEAFWGGVRNGGADVEVISPADLERAWIIGENFTDQEFSLTDRTSFAVMMRLGVRRVASFDRDFAIFRFGKKKAEAFEIVG